MTNRWLTGAVASSQIPLVIFPTLVPGIGTKAETVPDMNIAGYWGFVCRVTGYVGPACQVEDNANPGATQDIFFDANGFVTTPPPYGSNTRLIRVYDQLGNGDDLTAPLSANITIRFENSTYGTWRARFNGGAGLRTVNTVADSPAWAVANRPFWFASFIRRRFYVNLSELWMIPQSSSFMTMGLWQDDHVLSWRVNGSSHSNWSNTDIEVFPDEHYNTLARIQGDMSGASPAIGYFNGAQRSSRTFTHPLTYDSGSRLWIGDGGIGTPASGEEWFELGLYEANFQVTGTHILFFDNIMKEVFRTTQTMETRQQRLYAILGPGQEIVARQQRLYAVIAPKDLGVRQQRLYAVVGDRDDGVAVQDQRVYAIIQP